MTIIQISLVGSGTAPSGNWNNVTAPGTTGQKVADLIDSSGAPTGVSLWLIAGGTATTQSAATATYHGLPKEYWNNYWISALDATLSLELRGMPASASYSIDTSGYNLNGRDSDITVEGATQEYNTAGTADAPEAPVTLTGTVPGDGILAISSTKSAVDGQFYGYLNGWVVDYTASATPTITNIDGGTTFVPGASVVLNGSNFSTSGGSLTIGGVTQTITNRTASAITFTAVQGNNAYGKDLTLVYTDASSNTANLTVQQLPDTVNGFGYVDMSSPNTTDTSSVAYDTTPTVVTGDQFEWEDFNNLGNLTIDAQGFVTNVDTEGTFRGRFWDATDSTWGAVATFTASVPDSVAPVFSAAPAVSATTTSGHTITATLDEGGTIYGVRLADGAAAPSSAQVVAGQDSTGAAAPEAKSVAATAATPADLVFSTGTDGQPYDYYIVAQDDATTPNVQASPVLVQATTSITPPPPSVPGSGRRGFLRPAVRGTVNSIIGSIIS